MVDFITYLLIRSITLPFRYLPYRVIHFVGRNVGVLVYFCMPRWRKRCFSNLCLAKDLKLSENEMKKVARASFGHLVTTCLEYERFSREKNLDHIIRVCEKTQKPAREQLESKKGLIFLCGHQSNWELQFLLGTNLFPGTAIGRPIKNKYLYRWVLSIREQYGGKIIEPKNAIKGCLKALREGGFAGIVGDQAMPTSGFSSTFLGSKAWTSPVPAMLAYKTNTPIFVTNTIRRHGYYDINFSHPIYPDLTADKETEVKRMMTEALNFMQKGLIEFPSQWLWQHNRWKQASPKNVFYRYHYDTILVILKDNSELLDHIRLIYPNAFITVLCPKEHVESVLGKEAEVIPYSDEEGMLIRDYRFKLVFNFTDHSKVRRFYSKLSAFIVLNLADIHRLAEKQSDSASTLSDSQALYHAITRPGVFKDAKQSILPARPTRAEKPSLSF
ncbi:MAG: Lipid A biosynthesis lauroyltransferase [Chlamydiia bacterium]|nr:Lipid A biosynthesis lauroyltransferase [Chlamydiia bacterium]